MFIFPLLLLQYFETGARVWSKGVRGREGTTSSCCAHDAQIYMHAREHTGVALVHKHALNT